MIGKFEALGRESVLSQLPSSQASSPIFKIVRFAALPTLHGEFFNFPITKLHNFSMSGDSMEVILKEDVAKLGSRGDVVKVAEGYGRNFLLPRKLAIEANAANKAVIEQMKAASVRRSAKEKAQAEELSKQFDGLSVSFQRKSGEHEQLFG